jgi:hypothetical protein
MRPRELGSLPAELWESGDPERFIERMEGSVVRVGDITEGSALMDNPDLPNGGVTCQPWHRSILHRGVQPSPLSSRPRGEIQVVRLDFVGQRG